MPACSPADAGAFEAHGSRFDSLVRGERGASRPCARRLQVPDGTTAWVTTTRGLTAAIGEARMAPPWGQ